VPPLASSDAVGLFCDRSKLDATDEIAELCSRLDDGSTYSRADGTPIPDKRRSERRSSGRTSFSLPKSNSSSPAFPPLQAVAR